MSMCVCVNYIYIFMVFLDVRDYIGLSSKLGGLEILNSIWIFEDLGIFLFLNFFM